MRFSLCGFPLVFSFTLLSVFDTSLSATTISLTPEDSFHGDSQNAERSYNVQAGDVYSLTGDVSISNVDNSALNKACFNVTSGSVTFAGNHHGLYFNNISSGTTKEGAVLCCQDPQATARFSGFSTLSFIQSPGDIKEQGCLYSKNALMLLNNYVVRFEQNQSKTKGGAISGANVTIVGNYDSVSFYQNAATFGGAIHSSGPLQIAVNQAEIRFAQNTAKNGSGGALYSDGDIDIDQNAYVLFRENEALTTAIGKGGAVCCLPTSGSSTPVPIVTFSDNKQLVFERNHSIMGGGAIYARKLSISSGGPTLFINNISYANSQNLGGAIAIDTGGEISLSAEKGTITFQGNRTSLPFLNGIHLLQNAKFLKLQARNGYSIEFYDPITSEADGSTQLNINGDPKNKEYTGTILFSGEKSLANDPRDFKSTIPQNVNLSAGYLVIKEGAEVTVSKFTQSPGSHLVLDLGTKLIASKEDIAITGLAIDIDSLSSSSTAAVIKANTANKQISVTDSIELISPTGNAYEDLRMRNSQTFPLLSLEPGAGGSVTVTSGDFLPVSPHYGFQGNWKLAWTGTGNKVGEFFWDKINYKPRPEKEGNLVPNILWGNAVDVRSLMQVQETHASSLQTDRGLWIDGIGNFFHVSASEDNISYRHNSGGYVLSVNNEITPKHYTSMAFSQLFSRDKDYAVSKNEYRMYLGSYLYQYTTSLGNIFRYASRNPNVNVGILSRRFLQNPLMIFHFLCAYGHATNDMKTDYANFPMVKNSWRNNCWAIECGGSMPLLVFENGRLFQGAIPFMKLQLVYAYQGDFKETTADGRRFSNGSLTSISVPLGIRFEKLALSQDVLYDFSFSYIPDIFRKDPSCEAALVISGDSWLVPAAHVSRHAFVGSGTGRYHFNDYTELLCRGSIECRPHARNYNINCGSKFRF
uniref:Probable outer membrane protein pmp1 n=1 Tax=Chlamydia pneumoniae TaxID=83558 RepID=A0A0F7WUV3_CHLPN|nr:Probable outer membrane protein pmp1 [Chlamydia pneumoniae]